MQPRPTNKLHNEHCVHFELPQQERHHNQTQYHRDVRRKPRLERNRFRSTVPSFDSGVSSVDCKEAAAEQMTDRMTEVLVNKPATREDGITYVQ
jgi:hypothetical protein